MDFFSDCDAFQDDEYVFVFFSSPDKTYPQREGDSAESVAVLGSMFLGVQQLTLTVSQAVLMNL